VKETCICIAADVKNSSSIDSEKLTTSLMHCITLLNNTYKDNILIPFDIRNGDEIVGVLKLFSSGFVTAKTMLETLDIDGIQLYIGIGLGKLESKDATVHTMNGSAVLNAFKARDEYIKKSHHEVKPWVISEDKSTIFFYSEELPYQALNAISFSILEKTYNRSEKQKDVINLVQKVPGISYEQIGQQMGYKSPKSTVSYLLTRAQYHVVLNMEESLTQLLDDMQLRLVKEGD
jgi:hypothetical protein